MDVWGDAPPGPEHPLRVKRRLLLLLAGGGLFALSQLLARYPGVTESVWGTRIGPSVTWALSRVTGVFPFAVIELLFVVWLGWRTDCLMRAAGDLRRGTRRAWPAVAAFLLVLAQDAGVGVGIFYAAWGLSYARPPVETRLAWSEAELPEGLVAQLAEEEVRAANEAYRELHRSDDAGAPTARGDAGTLDTALEIGWQHGAAALGLEGVVLRRYGRYKRLLISPLLHRAGLSGFYAPFTGEANVNRSVPGVALPQVIAHEKAHQRAIAPEDEANFLGWWAAVCAPDPRARYSAHVFAQRQLLRTLLRHDREAAEALLEMRLPGVQRDVDDLSAYWEIARGRAARFTRAVNDAYLKTNRVEEGVAAYGGSVELLLRFAQRRGGTLATPSARPGAPAPFRRAGPG